MKSKVLMILIVDCMLLIISPQADAQWSTSGLNTYYEAGNVGIGKANTGSGLLTINGQVTSLLRLENDGSGLESSLRFRSKDTEGQWLHADISTYADGQFLGFKVPHHNDVGAGYRMVIRSNGNVGIGTTDPAAKLTINGTAKAEEMIVSENVGADFVFEEDYDLPDLLELEAFLKTYKHLPEVPSSDEMIHNGVKVGELQMKLLQKVEELTLYIIEQQKLTIHQQQLLEQQQKEIEQLKIKL